MAITRSRTPLASPKHCVSLLARLAAKTLPDTSTPLFRRECYRWALRAPAVIRYQAADGQQVTIDAAVEDLSGTGMGLLCQEALAMDLPAEVFLSAEGKTYSATVRVTHSTHSEKGYRIGCEFIVREAEE